MTMITIEIDDREVLAVFHELARRVDDLSPALKAIGEDMAESTKQRFATSRGPDGQTWPANSDVTLQRYLGLFSGTRKKGAARAGSKKPLIGESKELSRTINYQVVDGGRTLLVGSPEKYAAVQQFGASQGDFGRDKRNHPIPWGDIPARPFLGVSDEDKRVSIRARP